jgi:hypothetical protein
MPRPREKGPLFWRLSIAAMLSSVVGLFSFAAFNQSPAVHAATGCRIDGKMPAHVVLLIDQSDPFQPNDLGWVQQLADGEARALPRHGRLTVMTPNAGNPFTPNLLFSACSPGSAADANSLFQNPRMIEQAWQTKLMKPLLATLDAAMQEKVQPASPLSEALYAIADRADFQESAGARRLVVVSDLMQHSEAYSFYRTGADYQAYLASRLAETKPRLDSVDVIARIVPRQMYDLPLSDVKAFWRAYFSDAGAQYGSVN